MSNNNHVILIKAFHECCKITSALGGILKSKHRMRQNKSSASSHAVFVLRHL